MKIDLQSQLENVTAQKDSLSSEKSALQRRNSTLSRQKSSLSAENRNLNRLNSDLSSQNESQSAEIRDFRQNGSQLSIQVSSLNQENSDLHRRNQDLNSRISEISSELVHLRLSTSSTANEEQLRHENSELTNQVESLTRSLQLVTAELDKLRRKRNQEWEVEPSLLSVDFDDRLGVGGFGEVFQGEYRGMPVAVKRLLVQHATNVKAERTMRREFRALREQHHANIVRLVGVCSDEDSVDTNDHRLGKCIVIELAERGSLRNVLDEHGRNLEELSWGRRLDLLLGAALGLSSLHCQTPPVLHRDLKSHNVLVMGDWTAKLSDFGLAKTRTESTLSMGGKGLVATVQWAAPESLEDEFENSPESDVFSFGMIMYEVVTGLVPWDGKSVPKIMFALVGGRRPDLPADSPSSLRDLIVRCWDQEPENRPSMNIVVQELTMLSCKPDFRMMSLEEAPAEEERLETVKMEDLEVDKLLGCGAEGMVIQCSLEGSDRKLAVKACFNFHGSDLSVVKTKFVREYRILSGLPNHQRIVRYWTQWVEPMPPNVLDLAPGIYAEIMRENGENIDMIRMCK